MNWVFEKPNHSALVILGEDASRVGAALWVSSEGTSS